MNGKGIIDEVDNLEDIKKDEWEIESEALEIKEKKLKELKDTENNIETEFSVFDYDDS